MEVRPSVFLLCSLLAVTRGQAWGTTRRPNSVYSPSYGSCRYNCGYNLGSCSCSSSCRYYGNCCYDYYRYCGTTTKSPEIETSASYGSCRYNCGYHVGSCSCSSSCRYYGNCCYDYNRYCGMTTERPVTSASYGSCRYNCGYHVGSCSCSSSCRYYGNCCYDYHRYCGMTTESPYTSASYGSCRYNCGYHVGSCSCSSSCRYYGNCCYDYYRYCGMTTESPHTSAMHPQCGGNLLGSSGSFSSPNYPSYYPDYAYCVWNITAPFGHRVVLTITDIQLENCCGCDYIRVHDGPSLSSRPLGTVCFNSSMADFHSSSSYLTVLFRSDSSVVGRGFRADYTSSLPDSAGRVNCSSDNMNIVIQNSYLNSMGYSGHDLYVNDQYCRPRVWYDRTVFSFALNACGTRREFTNGRIMYTNGVRAYRSHSGEITRQSHFKLQVLCRMEQDATAQIMYVARETESGNITGSGTFNLTMAFYTSGNFYYPVYESPYVVSLNQYLYVQVKLRRPDSSLVLFLDTCVASPSPYDFQTRSYDLVRNGCRRDSTYYEYSSGSRQVAQFRFSAFAFLRSNPEVYLQCKVAVCRAYDYSSRCSQGCRMRKARGLRSAANSETATVILGPIQLRGPEKPEVELAKEGVVQTEAELPKEGVVQTGAELPKEGVVQTGAELPKEGLVQIEVELPKEGVVQKEE